MSVSCDERVINMYDIRGSKRYGKSWKRQGKSENPGRWLLKKAHQKFWAWKWKLCPEKRNSEIVVCETFSRPPKLGARSPPTLARHCVAYSRETFSISDETGNTKESPDFRNKYFWILIWQQGAYSFKRIAYSACVWSSTYWQQSRQNECHFVTFPFTFDACAALWIRTSLNLLALKWTTVINIEESLWCVTSELL